MASDQLSSHIYFYIDRNSLMYLPRFIACAQATTVQATVMMGDMIGVIGLRFVDFIRHETEFIRNYIVSRLH